ncbi:MAG: HD domain-containing phosphohydrolase [Acidobacteriota bacterium]
MTGRVLFVDDEPNVLDALRRQLSRRFDMETAVGGEAGLDAMATSDPFAVIVSDMRMPMMSGPEFLAKAREISPDSVQMILSGQAELQATIEAVNAGRLFRFMTKPCPRDVLIGCVESALEQHRLVMAERELLGQTLHGAVEVLTQILGLVSPDAFSRATRVQQYATQIAEMLGVSSDWQIRLAAMLSQIGCVSLPGDTLARLAAGQELREAELRMIASHPQVAGRLLGSIPRLESVAAMVAGQNTLPEPDARATSLDSWDLTQIGAQILRAAATFDALVSTGSTPAAAARALAEPDAAHHPAILAAVEALRPAQTAMEVRALNVEEMRLFMILDEDVQSATGLRLMQRGQELTQKTLERLRSFAEGVGVVEPIRVRMPQDARTGPLLTPAP